MAIVTGSTKGIGRVTAATMATEGAKVVLTGRTVAGEEMAAAIRVAGGEAIFVPADISDEDDIVRLIEVTLSTYGTLTTLVTTRRRPIISRVDGTVLDLSLEGWEAILRTTLTGTWLTCRHAIPPMVAGGGGSIVNISSEASRRRIPR